jgi:hypothetical protein
MVPLFKENKMKFIETPDREVLLEKFSYNPDTGIMIRNTTGKQVGTLRPDGRLCMAVNKRLYLFHRVAWKIVYGTDADNEIDHINCNPQDNRISNLRISDPVSNKRNLRRRKNNKSGYNGIYKCNKTNKWHAQIRNKLDPLKRQNISLGYYPNIEDAIKARKIAELKYGYDINHGEGEVA